MYAYVLFWVALKKMSVPCNGKRGCFIHYPDEIAKAMFHVFENQKFYICALYDNPSVLLIDGGEPLPPSRMFGWITGSLSAAP
jgi:hypothetical protein